MSNWCNLPVKLTVIGSLTGPGKSLKPCAVMIYTTPAISSLIMAL